MRDRFVADLDPIRVLEPWPDEVADYTGHLVIRPDGQVDRYVRANLSASQVRDFDMWSRGVLERALTPPYGLDDDWHQGVEGRAMWTRLVHLPADPFAAQLAGGP